GGRRFLHVVSAKRVLTTPSRIMEVAIYPDPERFFVPGTFSQLKATQEELVKKDGQELQARLGIEGLEEILPEAPEVTEVMFKHFDATGVRLLGEDYRDPNPETRYWRYIRTNTPINKSGPFIAIVGHFFAVYGPYVPDWNAYRADAFLGAARWVVKVKKTG
ncbi:MAG: hypothetical protein AAB694_00360, partial [Patescibacteria group bacterium]